MKSSCLEKLANTASVAVLPPPPVLSVETGRLAGNMYGQLLRAFEVKNGFNAFGGALCVLPAGVSRDAMSIDVWNSNGLWRTTYGDLASGCLFFAFDAFCGQYCLFENEVWRFDPESGGRTFFSHGLEEWACRILGDSDQETGEPLVKAWEAQFGPLKQGHRLFAKYPFVLGGAFEIENLRAVDAVAGMRHLGELATQLHDLPDGARVDLRIVD